MYQKRDDLNNLVWSLTNGEKRYLTNIFKQSKEDALYVALYEKIQNAKSGTINDSSEISGRVKIDKKRFLYKTILKHLKQMHPKSSPDVIIQNYLAEVEILYNHSLADQAMRLLTKAKELANKHEKFGLYLQVLQWEQRLNIVLAQPVRSIADIRNEEGAVLEKNAQINLLLGFYSQVMLLKKEYGYAKGDVKKELDITVIMHPSFPKEKDCISNKAKYYYNLIYSIYHWMTFNHEKAWEYSQSLLKDDGQNILPSDYINGLFQHITSSVCVVRFHDALYGIQLAQAFMEEYKLNQSNQYKQLFFAYDATYRMIIYGYMGNKEELKAVIHTSERQLEQWGDVIPIELRQVVLGNIMNAYVAVDDLDNAWIVWNQLFNKQFKNIRKDIYADLFLFRILFLLQSKTYELVHSAAASALRFYRKTEEHKSQFQLETKLALLFAKELDYENKKTLAPILHSFKLKLQDFIKDIRGGIGFQEHYSRYIIWANAIEKDVPYYEAAREWYTDFSVKVK